MAHDDPAVGLVHRGFGAQPAQQVFEVLGRRNPCLDPVVDGTGDVDGVDDAIIGRDQLDERRIGRTVIEPDVHRDLEGTTQLGVVDGRMKPLDDTLLDESRQASAGGIRAQTDNSSQLSMSRSAVAL